MICLFIVVIVHLLPLPVLLYSHATTATPFKWHSQPHGTCMLPQSQQIPLVSVPILHFHLGSFARASQLSEQRINCRRWLARWHIIRVESVANVWTCSDLLGLSRRFRPRSDLHTVIMEGIQTHPSNAAQAKAFTAPGSLSFPGATNELTPPGGNGDNTQKPSPNGQQAANGNGVTPATPAATPAATNQNQGPSGITPTLQYVSSWVT